MAVIVAGLQERVVARLEIGEGRKWGKMFALENEVLHVEFSCIVTDRFVTRDNYEPVGYMSSENGRTWE